jgi:signal transduction histidine kinase
MKPRTIAVVEDQEAHFELIKRSFDRELPAAEVRHFCDAMTCLESLREYRPDIIIVDYLLSGMDGIQLLEELNKAKIDIPVIMMTGQGDENIAVRAIKLGACDYLVKSAGFFALLPSVVEKAIRERELKDSEARKTRLNDLLLNSLPHPVMLVKRDRTIVAANRVAEGMGAKVGGCCWSKVGQSHFVPRDHELAAKGNPNDAHEHCAKCPFCLIEESIAQKRTLHATEVHTLERVWDYSWVPVDEETTLAIAIDVTERIEAEEALRRERDSVRLLAAQLLRVQEDERKRIAGDLHDSFGSGLAAIKSCLESAFDGLQKGAVKPESIQNAVSILKQLLEESRRIINDLRPAILDDLGIVQAVGWFCRQFRNIHPDMHVEETIEVDEEDIPEQLKIAIFRVLQESFNNIVKHSRAEFISLSLVKANGAIELMIEDNGVGFDLGAVLSFEKERRGVGLTSMKERIELSGGSLAIAATPGEGTRIQASWSGANLD